MTLPPFIDPFAARTPTLPPATHTNSYALGGRDVLLVEPATPYEDEQRKWIEWARGLASHGRRPIALFLTHHHPDHSEGAGTMSRELGLPIWAHAKTAERLEDLPVARRLDDGEELTLDGPESQRWKVLLTPGHAPGHLCLFEEHLGTVIVGDMVASEGTILVETHDGNMRLYLEQLDRLRSLGARVALPAHGKPIEDPHALFSRYIQHRLLREERVLAALRAAGEPGATPSELVPNAYADTPRASWGLAALSLAAHLVKLEADGLALTRDGRYFARTGS